jgi:energy-coupling factor transporter ATP-binding protein EcfA2
MLFLEKKVCFQGDEIKLGTIVKNDDVGMLNALGYDSVSRLLDNETLGIGIHIEDKIGYYIDRTLLCNKDSNIRAAVKGETKPASNNDIRQEFQDISSYREKEMGRETSRGLTPSTLLEVEGRVILVTDEPGMGKSTLLTHLARETRNSHPDMWIVRVNINNYTSVLNELQTNGSDENGAMKLLTEAAQVKETDSLHLDRRLFDVTCSSTGNMVVLIDGVDEVSPRYTEEVIQVLKILSKTKIKKIWVTSQNSVRDRLKTEFHCQSYSLVPFSEEDQKHFLLKFWKKACPEIEDDNLEALANRNVKLATEQLTVQTKQFMGIPMQCWLLAQMFEGNLKQCTTASKVELPEHINVIMLYDRYVEKKWDIYLVEKKNLIQQACMR